MGSSSGLIIAFVVAVWAAYFVPLVLRRYDDAGKNASVHEAGSTGRVIAATSPQAEKATPEPAATPAAKPVASLDRPAARLAAQRRRRTLITLIALLVVVAGLAVASIIPRLAVGAPVAVIAAWLVACRVQVRGERGLSRPKKVREPRAADQPRKKTAAEEETVVLSGQFEDVDPARAHVMEQVDLEVDALDDKIVIAVPSVSTTGAALWDPLPVTLPTYVTKPRAGRTVRTIDFAKPGAWTSGHIEGENVQLPQRDQHDEGHAPATERRAVGH